MMTMANNRKKTNDQVQNQKSNVSFGTIGPKLQGILLSENVMNVVKRPNSILPEITNLMNKSKYEFDALPSVLSDESYPCNPDFCKHLYTFVIKGGQERNMPVCLASNDAKNWGNALMRLSNEYNILEFLKKLENLATLNGKFREKMVPRLNKKLTQKVNPQIKKTEEKISNLDTELKELKANIFNPNSKISINDISNKETEIALAQVNLNKTVIRKNNLIKHMDKNYYDHKEAELIKDTYKISAQEEKEFNLHFNLPRCEEKLVNIIHVPNGHGEFEAMRC